MVLAARCDPLVVGACARNASQLTDSCFGDLIDEEEVTLGQHILLEMTEHHLMPFEGFRAMPDFAVSLQILLDRSFNRQALTFLW